MSNTVSMVELSAFCDGELDRVEHDRIAKVLEEDPALRAQMSRMMRDRANLAAAADVDGADPAADALAARLADRLRVQRMRQQFMQLGTGAAAVVAVAAAGWFGNEGYPDRLAPAGGETRFLASADNSVPSFVADAAGAHVIFAPDTVHPVEFFSSDEPVMRDWFATHLGQGVMIPHLEELGFELIGGRLLGDSEGAMAQLLYHNNRDDRVSLIFGRRALPGAGEDLKLVRVGKTYASYWREGDYSWAVVEDTPGADVSAVATHVAGLVRAPRN